MASNTVAVRLPEEVLEELQRRASVQNKKISDVVRELIVSGLVNDPASGALAAKIDRLEKLATKAALAAGKAQFLASMSVGFCADMTKLMVSNEIPSSEEKTAFLAQTNEWAEGFAQGYLMDEERDDVK
ncbi:MAG: hypothetical protein AB1457_17245 [Chloroflexota bacterium]|jgi:hypothetical protein